MAKLLTTLNNVGNFLIREQWRDRNFCRVDGSVNVTPSATSTEVIEVGEVVARDSTSTTAAYVRLSDGVIPANAEYGIVVDERVQDPVFYNSVATVGKGAEYVAGTDQTIQPNWSTDTVTLAVMVKGDAMVRTDGLNFGTTVVGEIATARAAMEAAGIVFNDQLTGKYTNDSLRALTPIVAA